MATTAFSAIIEYTKRKYITRPEWLQNLAIRDKPLLRSMTRVDDFDGEALLASLNYSLGVGGSASFPLAQANWTMPTAFRITLTRKLIYQVSRLKGETIHATRRNAGALLDMADKANMDTLEYMSQLLARQAWSDQAANIGQVQSISSDTIVLTDPTSAVNFHEGQFIMFWPAASRTGAPTLFRGVAPVHRLQVARVNHAPADGTNPTVSFSAAVSTIAGGGGSVAATDYMYIEGMYDMGGNGIPAFIPAADPLVGDNFLGGGSRYKAPTLLAGWRQPAKGTIEDSLKNLCARMAPYVTARKLTAWLSADSFYRLDVEAGARAIRNYADGRMAKMGFTTFAIATPLGVLECAMDPYAPNDSVRVLDDSWLIHTLLAWPHVIDDDGRGAMRITDDDGVETRYRGWHDFHCPYPVKQGYTAIPA
jgi:hypothetical protein